MSYQRPTTTTGMTTGSASYSEFLKDIYSSLRTLSTGLALINTRLDTVSQQLQKFETQLTNQDQRAEFLSARIDTLIQQTQNTQIRQSTNSISLLNELDTLGTRQVEPSTIINEVATRQQSNLRVPANRILFDIPEINITEDEINGCGTLNNLLGIDNKQENIQPSTTIEAGHLNSQNMEQQLNPKNQSEQTIINNFLILD